VDDLGPPRKVSLLMVSGAVGHERDGRVFISDEQARKLEALPTKFDTTLVVKNRGPRSDLTFPLPPGMQPAWISAYRSKWQILSPRRFFALWKQVKATDAFLTFVPALDGVAPLILALLARRPRYIVLIASPIHFRHDASGGRATAGFMTALVNACGAIATRILVNGKALEDDLLPVLRKKVSEVVVSSHSTADLIPPRVPGTGKVQLLCVCRLVPSKRVDAVIEATHLLVERDVDAHLDVVGDGPLMDDLRKQAEKLDLQDRVQFAGWIPDRERLRDYYASADFFLFATETEGISLAIQEAMVAGTPVISTDAGGLKEFLNDGEDSLVIGSPDPVALADGVQRLLEDTDTYMRLAAGAQKKVSALSNETWVRDLHHLVLEDIDRRGTGA